MISPGLHADIHLRLSAEFSLALTLSIPPGRTVALLGPNGAGKSTTIAALAGLRPIDRGRVRLDEVVLDDPAAGRFVPPEARNTGVVFQQYLLFPHMTVFENVAFGLRARGIDRQAADERAASILGRIGLQELAQLRPEALSGGQKQRVALARALVIEPAMLLLDEPLSALDVSTRAQLRRELRRLLDAFDGPRLLITHDPTEAFLLADDVHILENGRISQAGSPDEIRLKPRTRYAADLAGVNLVMGDASQGTVQIGNHPLHVADKDQSGPVIATIAPTAISIHRRLPEGSPRNTWETRIELIERLGDRVRLQVGSPLPLTIEVTDTAADELRLAPNEQVWLSIKATEIAVAPDA